MRLADQLTIVFNAVCAFAHRDWLLCCLRFEEFVLEREVRLDPLAPSRLVVEVNVVSLLVFVCGLLRVVVPLEPGEV